MMPIREAMTDSQLFGGMFGGDSWEAWRVLLAGFYGERLTGEDEPLWRELTGRLSFPKAPHDELWLAIGRRGGKSDAAALIALWEALTDHRARLAPGEVCTIMVIAADRKQARTILRYLSGMIAHPMIAPLVVREGPESIEFEHRTVIEITTASHRATRGYSVGAVICDEIAFWRCEGANPDAEILRALRPSLATLGGKLIALSSPYARRGVLWDAYRKHYGKDGRVLVAQAPTATMNPTVDAEIIKAAYAEDEISARAEYGAEFRTDVESYVNLEALDACTRPSHSELPPSPREKHTAFVDPSGGSVDAFTLAIVHREQERVIVDCIRSVKPPFSPETVVTEFAELLRSYHVREVHGDAYAGLWPAEQFEKRGITYKRSEKPKSDLYRDLLPLLNSERVQLPPNEQLRRELLGLERRTSRGGRDIIDHTQGAHDDLANAVAGAVVHAKKPECVIYTGIPSCC